MNTIEKEQAIRDICMDMLTDSHNRARNLVNKAIQSGALDISGWDMDIQPMVIPKVIVTAILENESTQYSAVGTSFEKRVKKEVKNLKLFI